jgi:hypothetical protein
MLNCVILIIAAGPKESGNTHRGSIPWTLLLEQVMFDPMNVLSMMSNAFWYWFVTNPKTYTTTGIHQH